MHIFTGYKSLTVIKNGTYGLKIWPSSLRAQKNFTHNQLITIHFIDIRWLQGTTFCEYNR